MSKRARQQIILNRRKKKSRYQRKKERQRLLKGLKANLKSGYKFGGKK